MKAEKYHVYFRCGQYVTVFAFNEDDARILAKAERIKAGQDHTVTRIVMVTKD